MIADKTNPATLTLDPAPSAAGAVSRKKAQSPRTRGGVPWMFLLPAALCFVLLVVVPAGSSIVMSFTDYSGIGDANFVGADNYSALLSDPQALASIANTFSLAIFVVIFQNALGLALALALEKDFAGRNVLRVVFFLPAVVSPVIIAFLWQYIYSPNGALNQGLSAIGLKGLSATWLGDPKLALWAIGVAIVWQVSGYAMVIYVAGLQNIPSELTEAAAIDGASAWKRFWFIRFPLLAPALTINLVLSLISGLRYFDQILAMTGGGPGYATETISTIIYKQGFVFGHVAYATSLAVVLTLAVGLLAAVQVTLLRRREAE